MSVGVGPFGSLRLTPTVSVSAVSPVRVNVNVTVPSSTTVSLSDAMLISGRPSSWAWAGNALAANSPPAMHSAKMAARRESDAGLVGWITARPRVRHGRGAGQHLRQLRDAALPYPREASEEGKLGRQKVVRAASAASRLAAAITSPTTHATGSVDVVDALPSGDCP